MNRENQTHEVIMNTVEVGVGVGVGMGATLNTACITVLSQSVYTTFVSWNSIFNRLLIPAEAFDPVFFLLYNPLKSLLGQNKTNSHATKPRQIHTQPNQDKFTRNQTKTNSHATKPRQIHTQPNQDKFTRNQTEMILFLWWKKIQRNFSSLCPSSESTASAHSKQRSSAYFHFCPSLSHKWQYLLPAIDKYQEYI